VLVYMQAILSPETSLADGVVVFMGAVVGHGASVGTGSVIAAGAVLNARVTIEDEVYVGSNASVLPDLRIGAGATVGANTLVATDVPAGATIVGVPGQVLQTAAEPDRHAAEPIAATTDDTARHAVPELESRLMAILHRVLGESRATATDRFFDAGGTSLKAIHLLAEVRSTLGHDVPLHVLYARCSMRELALHLLGLLPTGEAAEAARARAMMRRRHAGVAATVPPRP